MAGALLPMTVSAKVLPAEVLVPSLARRTSLFHKDHKLQKGVHVHWALPDALTSARLDPDAGGIALFPGVPDLWLVTRIDQPAPAVVGVKRAWRAWVVSSRDGKAISLQEWTGRPANVDRNTIHTAAGMLPSAASMGAPGWGVLDAAAEGAEFDPLRTAYYPACRTRLGLHDPLHHFVGDTVSYTVVGWYWSPEHDPLHTAENTERLLERWKLLHEDYAPQGPVVDVGAAIATAPPAAPWTPATMQVTESAATPVNVANAGRFARAGAAHAAGRQRLETMRRSFDGADSVIVNAVAQRPGADEIRCHGGVSGVKLSAPLIEGEALSDSQVGLYPTVKRAMAGIVGFGLDEAALDEVEALLGGHDHQTETSAGIFDLPGALHAATFQAVPGQAQAYARLEIHPAPPSQRPQGFGLGATPVLGDRGQGHWPPLPASVTSTSTIPPDARYMAPPQRIEGPSVDEVNEWLAKVKTAFDALIKSTSSAGEPVDQRFLRLQDNRRQPTARGPFAAGESADGSESWIDMADGAIDETLKRLLDVCAGSLVELPHLANVYRRPGPRWYRPWSPQLVLFGVGRGHKFGYDGRFRDDGLVRTRVSGETIAALTIGDHGTVRGADLLADPDTLLAKPGLPPEASALIYESLLLDPHSATAMAAAMAPRSKPRERAAVAMQCRAAVRGLSLARDRAFSATNAAALSRIQPQGMMPSEVAWTDWEDPRDPLFVDVAYAYAHTSLTEDWQLEPHHVECTPDADPKPAQLQVFQERTQVTAAMLSVLDDSIKKVIIGKFGVEQPERGFVETNVVSAPLTDLDRRIFDAGGRERSGALRMTKISLVDMFGFEQRWEPQIEEPAPDVEGLSFHTDLAPRLPYWARLIFALQSAADPDRRATPGDSPVCGFLLPDYLEDTLEVFDADGRALGQIGSDPPQAGRPASPLTARFDVHPWVAPPTPGEPLSAIANPTLRTLVGSVLSQTSAQTSADPASFETGMTAMMRVTNTMRRTLDPAMQSGARMGRLLGEPIVVLRARVALQATAETSPTALTGSPDPLVSPPALPTISVRIGDVTRPDDGVLGCFIAGATPADGRFVPVTGQAAQQAIVSPHQTGRRAVEHRFIDVNGTAFELAPRQALDLVILCDPRGGLYATSGVLPRKKISLPIELIEPALARLEPSFPVGPVLSVRRAGSARPFVPPPSIPGLAAEFVYETQSASATHAATFGETPVPAAPPVAELPSGRVTLDRGWLRLFEIDG